MDEVALVDVELAVVGFDLEDVGLDEDALDLGGHVVDGDVAGRSTLRRGDEVAGALVGDANQIGAAAGLVEGVVSFGVGGGVGYFAHAGLDVDQDNGVAGGGLAGGFVGDGAGDSGGLRESGARTERLRARVRRTNWVDFMIVMSVLWV